MKVSSCFTPGLPVHSLTPNFSSISAQWCSSSHWQCFSPLPPQRVSAASAALWAETTDKNTQGGSQESQHTCLCPITLLAPSTPAMISSTPVMPLQPCQGQVSAQRANSTLLQLTSFPPQMQPVSMGHQFAAVPVCPSTAWQSGSWHRPAVHRPRSPRRRAGGGETALGLWLLSDHSCNYSVTQPTNTFLLPPLPCRE